MEIPKKIKDEIWDYCRINDITNIDQFTINLLINGFNIEKYGNNPLNTNNQIKVVEKEVIKEIPIEKVIEKEVYVEYTEKLKELENIILIYKEQIEQLQTQLNDQHNIKVGEDVNVLPLYDKIKRLELELELESNKNKTIKPEPKIFEIGNKKENIIKWFSNDKNKDNDIYGED